MRSTLHSDRRRWGALCAILLGALLFASDAESRPGGGSSFRSSSSSRSSSRSSSSSHSSSSRSYSSSSHSYAGSSSGGDLDPAVFDVLFGMVLGIPGLIGWSLLIAGFRTQQSGKQRGQRGRPSGFRLLMGVLVLAFFALVLGGQFRHAATATAVGMLFAAVGGLIYQLSQLNQTASVQVAQAAPRRNPEQLAQLLVALKRRDEGYSRVAFLDYVQALYHALYGWVGTPGYRNLSAFVADDVMRSVARGASAPSPDSRYEAIVLGAMSLAQINLAAQPDGKDAILVELEGNYTRQGAGPAAPSEEAERLVVREQWRLERARGVVSPAPERMRVLSCTACGAALSVSDLGACTYCGAQLADGKLQWRLTRRTVLSTETFSTEGLGETVPEEGTDLPTVLDARLDKDGPAFAAGQGQPDLGAFCEAFVAEVLTPTFQQMYAAWSSKQWNSARPLLTDFLWESQQRWVRAYAERGLTNRLDDLRLTSTELARVERDKYYDAVTVRLFASCKDYTTDKTGKVIGGDAKRPRQFSEYWTFIRAVSPRSAARATDRKCPNCGAPVDQIGSTGVCGYCNAKITTGDFGWVLATITQDEVYTA